MNRSEKLTQDYQCHERGKEGEASTKEQTEAGVNLDLQVWLLFMGWGRIMDNYNLSKPKKENIRCVQCKKALYDLGIAEVMTPGGNIVRAYSVERTLCDILRVHGHVDIQIVTEAFKHYATRSDKNIPVLSEYAKVLRVEPKLRSYLEVLL